MLAGRYELKFPLGPAQRAALMASAREALAEDPHGTGAVYRVASLYFDSPGRLAFREKLDGEYRRRKFRLRWYPLPGEGEGAMSAAFMEIKHRIDQRVLKERLPLDPAGAREILADPERLRDLREFVLGRRGEETVGSILRQLERQHLQPVAVISYVREAWMGALDERLRLTFDSACQVHSPERWPEAADGTGLPLLPPERHIMEVKFDRRLERWLRDLIVTQGLVQRRFSKYARGVEELGGA